MEAKTPRERYPWWVKLSLWGLPNKASVWAFVGISVLCAFGCAAFAMLAGNPVWYAGLLFLVAALIYWLSIRWVDSHGSWDRDIPR
jgi:hypothetical protein